MVGGGYVDLTGGDERRESATCSSVEFEEESDSLSVYWKDFFSYSIHSHLINGELVGLRTCLVFS